MRDGEETTTGHSNESPLSGDSQGILVRYGHRLYRAKRLSSGNWLILDPANKDRRTITNGEFLANYERVPEQHDR